MVMDWADTLYFGMYRGHKVREVFDMRPTYLMWIVLNTKHSVVPQVEQALIKWAERPLRPLSRDWYIVDKFQTKYRGSGPW